MSRRIIAVLVAKDAAADLERTLNAVAAQSYPVSKLAIVDKTGNNEVAKLIESANADIVLKISAQKNYNESIAAALSEIPAETNDWIWLLGSDNAPAETALQELIRQAEVSPSLAVIGPKLMDSYDSSRIHIYGETLTSSGYSIPLAANELDQGQFDTVSDVLAVPISGMLTRRDLWTELGGLDPALPNIDSGVDYSIRARLTGKRVAVSPKAKVSYNPKRNKFAPDSSVTAKRKAQYYRRLKYVSAALLPFAWLALLPEGLLRAIWALLTKKPKQVLPELVAALAGVLQIGKVFAGRRQLVSSKFSYGTTIGPLKQSFSDTRKTAALKREQRRELRTGSSEPVYYLFGGGALTALVLLGIGIIGYGNFWGATSIVGGGISGLPSFAELWRNALWHDGILTGPNDPFALVLAGLGSLTFWQPSLVFGALYVLALPMASTGMWLLAARLKAGQLVRVAASFSWALAPMFLSALNDGRLGAVIAHILLPWLVLAVRAARFSWSGVGSSAILSILVISSAPSLAPLVVIGYIAWLIWRVKAWYRLIFIPIPAIVFFWPYVTAVLSIAAPFALLADPGIPLGYEQPAAWELALGFAEHGLGGWVSWFVGFTTPFLFAGTIVAICVAPFGVGAVSALLSKRLIMVAVSLVFALLGYTMALMVSNMSIFSIAGAHIHIWPGSTLSAYWLGLCAALVIGLGGVRHGILPALSILGSVVLSVPMLVAPLLGNTQVQPNSRMLPAIVVAKAQSNPQVGTLVLTPVSDGSLLVELLRGEGRTLVTQSVISRLKPVTEQELFAGQAAVNLSNGVGLDAEALGKLGVKYVLLTDPQPELVGPGLPEEPTEPATVQLHEHVKAGLNSVVQLSKVGETTAGMFWLNTAEQTDQVTVFIEPDQQNKTYAWILFATLGLALVLCIPTRRS